MIGRAPLVMTAALLLALFACGGPPPATPTGDPAGEPPQSSSPHALPGEAKGEPTSRPEDEKNPAGRVGDPGPGGPHIGPFAHLWSAETGDWNSAILITPDGDVLSFSSRGIRVHARDDGRVLHQANGCSPVSEDGVAFLAPDRFVVVCDRELREFSWPKMVSKRLLSFAERVDCAAVGGGLVAVAEDGFFAKDGKGKIFLHDLRDGSLLDAFAPTAEVQKLALSPDGTKLLIGMRDSGIVLRDVRAKTSQTWEQKTDADGAAFSPDGKVVFGDFASFEASMIDVASRKPRRRWRVGSWLTASRWIDAATVAATGSDGLAIFGSGEAPIASPVDDLGEGIALAPDGRTLCAGGRGGRIACFGTSRPGPTVLASSFTDAASPGAAGSDAALAASPALDARILARNGKLLEVAVDRAAVVEVGSTGSVSKPFQTNVGFALSGWIVVAEVIVVKVVPGKLTLEIVESKSTMTVNGRPVDHFAPGAAKLALTPRP